MFKSLLKFFELVLVLWCFIVLFWLICESVFII
jgi:hypothetical protein